MAQAKGVLPTKGDDREVLYQNPRMAGYFIGVQLTATATPSDLQAWLPTVDAAIDALVARGTPTDQLPKGPKLASVAVGLGAGFFAKLNAGGEVLERPVGLRDELQPPDGGWFGPVSVTAVDVLFYVAATDEVRALEFLDRLGQSPLVASVSLERGQQRRDETEHFGYKDGLRNIAKSDRTRTVFIHTDGDQPDEPSWAEGGSYLATMKIVQNRAAFAALADDPARDATIGRLKDGSRLDLVGQNIDPHDEPADIPTNLAPTSHVRKAGPRGVHDDTGIFRRGLPFTEVVEGHVQVGLHFASFQANPTQFETVFRDWLLNTRFPDLGDQMAHGADALLVDPIVRMQQAGMFFVPPYVEGGLAAALAPATPKRKPKLGRLVISKRVTNPADTSQRFERGGFSFHVLDDTAAVVAGSEFTTASTGRGVCPVKLEIGRTYTVVELSSPIPVAAMASVPVTMSKPNEHLRIDNQATQPGTGYGVRT